MEKNEKDIVTGLLPSSRMTLRELEAIRNKMIAATTTVAMFCGLRFEPGLESTQVLLRAYASAISKRKAQRPKNQANRFTNAKP